MSKIFTIFSVIALAAVHPLAAEEAADDLAKIRQDRERLIDLVIALQEDFGGTLKDYAQLQDDYAALLKKKAAPDHSAKVAELQKKLDAALARLKKQDAAKAATPAPQKATSSHALLEQDLVNLRNELHRQRQELLVARARVLRVKQLEEQNKTLEAQIKEESARHAKTTGQLKEVRAERDALMNQLKESMAKFAESEKARQALATRLDQLEKENAALKKKIRDQDARLVGLLKMEEQHEQTLAAAAELKQENLRLTGLLTEREKQLANLQKHLAAEVKRTLEIPVLIQARDALQEKLKDREARTRELSDENEALLSRKEALEQQIAEVKKNIVGMRDQLEKNKAAMATVTELTEENKTLQVKKDELQGTLEKAKAELVKSMGTRKQLEARLAESKKLAEANAKLKQLNTALTEEQDLLHDRLVKTEASLKESQQTTDDLQSSMLELTKDKADLTNAISENEAEIETLRSKVAGQPEVTRSLEQLEAEKKELAAKLKQREEDLEKTREELGRLQISATVAKKQLVSLKRENAEIEPVRYALGEAQISAQQTRVLSQVQEVLRLFPEARFEIVGHTCDLGKASANLKLSQKRAQALHDFLLSKGIPEDRLKSRGVGQTEPLVPNTCEKNRRLNRRVVVEILD